MKVSAIHDKRTLNTNKPARGNGRKINQDNTFFYLNNLGFLQEFMGQKRPPNGDHLSESPPIWEPLPRVDGQFHPDPGQDSNPCARGSQGSTVPRWPFKFISNKAELTSFHLMSSARLYLQCGGRHQVSYVMHSKVVWQAGKCVHVM